MREIIERTFNEKYDTYGMFIYRLAYLYLQNKYDAEDAVQEVFLKLLYKAPEFKNGQHEKAWIGRVTVNLCKNILKSSWKRKTVPLNEWLPADYTERDFVVLEQLFRLKPEYKAVVYLYFVEGYNLREISHILHLTQSAVKMRFRRAKEILKTNLEEEGYCGV